MHTKVHKIFSDTVHLSDCSHKNSYRVLQKNSSYVINKYDFVVNVKLTMRTAKFKLFLSGLDLQLHCTSPEKLCVLVQSSVLQSFLE